MCSISSIYISLFVIFQYDASRKIILEKPFHLMFSSISTFFNWVTIFTAVKTLSTTSKQQSGEYAYLFKNQKRSDWTFQFCFACYQLKNNSWNAHFWNVLVYIQKAFWILMHNFGICTVYFLIYYLHSNRFLSLLLTWECFKWFVNIERDELIIRAQISRLNMTKLKRQSSLQQTIMVMNPIDQIIVFKVQLFVHCSCYQHIFLVQVRTCCLMRIWCLLQVKTCFIKQQLSLKMGFWVLSWNEYESKQGDFSITIREIKNIVRNSFYKQFLLIFPF